MADARLKIIIEAINKSRGELGTLKKDLAAIEGGGKKADKSVMGLAGALKAAGIAALAFKTGKMAYDLGVLGAQAERVEDGFARMVGGGSEARVMLASLKEATMDTRSEVELMAGATTILALGFADDADQLADIMRTVEGLGARFGGNMQMFNLMISNQSLRRVDSFGMSITEVTERIDEFVASGENAEDAFRLAVLDVMADKFDQLGGSVEDSMTEVLRGKAAFADLRTEIGMRFTPAVAGANTIVGKFTGQWGDNLRAMREAGSEIGWLRANFAMLGDVVGLNNTAFDKWREAQEQAAEAAEFGAVMAGGFAERLDIYKLSQIEAGEVTLTSAEAWDMYAAAMAKQDTALMAELVAHNWEVAESASAAAIATLDHAASLGEMSEARFAQESIDNLAEAMREAKMPSDEITAATRELMIGFGLLTKAEEGAQVTLGELTQAWLDGKISLEQYRIGVDLLKRSIDTIESKTVTITANIRYNDPGWGGPGLTTPGKGEEDIAFANGGYIPAGAFGIVGERGPEIAQATRSGVQVTPISQVDRSIHLGGVTINTQAGPQMAMRQLSQMEF